MAKTGVADALRRKMEAAADTIPARATEPASARSAAQTRVGKKFITFPVSAEAKTQFDILAAEQGQRREELMREALRDLFVKYRKPPIA
jgi:hypothetical protein